LKIIEDFKLLKSVKKNFMISYFIIVKQYLVNINTPIKVIEKKSGVPFSLSLSNLAHLSPLLDENWEIIDSNNTCIKLKGPKEEIIRCRVKKGFDLGHIGEIFLNNVYGTEFEGKNVIDIGMSNGDSSIFFAKNGAKRVIGVEPDIRSFNIALVNINESKVSEIVSPLNKALNTQSGNVKLTVYDESPNANSIDEENMINLSGMKFTESVEGISLSEIIDVFNGEYIDFLKIDCEGCEYKVIRGIPEKYFSKILHLHLEFHHGLQDIPELLRKQGFQINIIQNSKLVGYIIAGRKQV